MKPWTVSTARRRLWSCGALLSIAACQSTPDAMQFANIAAMTPAQLQQVQAVVADAVGRENVAISQRAFATTHILVLEPAVRSTPLGTVATGTTTSRPRTFHLLGDGDRCVLEDQKTGTRYPLAFACGPDH